MLKSIIYNIEDLDYFKILDQLKLPEEISYINIKSTIDAFNVIKNMNVRGAPLIAIVGICAISLEIKLLQHKFSTNKQLYGYLEPKINYLKSSRPTAVNLENSLNKIYDILSSVEFKLEEKITKIIKMGNIMIENDLQINKKLSKNGANNIIKDLNLDNNEKKINVVHICNTGTLATAGYGTALGIVRKLHELNKLNCCYVLETRPYNQGSRLTTFELVEDNIPCCLITDSALTSLLTLKKIDLSICGSDRTAKNGDTANKIGTLQLATLSKCFNIPFYVACPEDSFDNTILNGQHINIEYRASDELRYINTKNGKYLISSDKVEVWNPAFDITPKNLITKIFTENRFIDPNI